MSYPIHAAQATAFYEIPPTTSEPGANHWVSRAANFVVVVTRITAGGVIAHEAELDEHFVLIPENMAAHVQAGDEIAETTGDTLFIVPPGASRIEVRQDGYIYRVFTSRNSELTNATANTETHTSPMPEVAPLLEWPMPVDGYRLRKYALADYIRPENNMRLFRTRCLMVNIFTTQHKPRDVRKMTPHSHADFEQGALTLAGQHVHHLRYPWTQDMTAWLEDQHLKLEAPSFTLIPPRVIHTSQAIGTAPTRLVEIFAPPRTDFSSTPGKVCNAEDYPLPEGL